MDIQLQKTACTYAIYNKMDSNISKHTEKNFWDTVTPLIGIKKCLIQRIPLGIYLIMAQYCQFGKFKNLAKVNESELLDTSFTGSLSKIKVQIFSHHLNESLNQYNYVKGMHFWNVQGIVIGPLALHQSFFLNLMSFLKYKMFAILFGHFGIRYYYCNQTERSLWSCI